MLRGDIVTVSLQGDYGKPRPAIVVQTDELPGSYSSVILCPITSVITTLSFRVALAPDADNGPREPSQVMTDKIVGIPRDKVGKTIGGLAGKQMQEVNSPLAFLLALNQTITS